ncbi:ABC transporter ATP-binding protein, partial [termite gut metagenome]
DVLKDAVREFSGTVIVVSHDREFLDGLASKVYEFGGGQGKEHLGGIYEFLQVKKIENLNELNVVPSVMKPESKKKLSNADIPPSIKQTYEVQKENNKKIKKLKKQIGNCEAKIEKLETEIKETEYRMATPSGASDMGLYEQHQQLKQQLEKTVEEWEQLSVELEGSAS